LVALVVAQTPILLEQQVLGAGTGEDQGDAAEFSFEAPGDIDTLYVTWFPCRGKMGFKVDSERYGERVAENTDTNNGVTYRTLSYNSVSNGDEFDIIITNNWEDGNSIFNLVVTSAPINTVEPGNDGEISATFVDGKSKLRIEWEGTGQDGDTYSIWASEIAYQGSDEFSQLLSACGVEDWMQLVASDSEISNDGDTFFYEADVDDDEAITEGTFTVIVSRADSLDGVYNLVTSTGVSAACTIEIPKIAIFLLAAFLVALFKF